MNFSLNDLNEAQRQAASIITGPVLVLAGAGSGKTRTLTYRIANMLEQGIPGGNILAVTFTNKASKEMRGRVAKLTGDSRLERLTSYFAPGTEMDFPLIGTFHFFCLRVLREDIEKLDFRPNFVILDSTEQLALVRKIIKGEELDPERTKPKVVQAKISSLKSDLITPEKFKNNITSYFEEKVALIYEKYQKELLLNNSLDFDDIINYTLTLWQKFPETLKKYQDRFPYLLVDEYQDTNQAQYQLTSLLAKKSGNIFVVGDDYQSIYAWRGANIRNILNFEKDYPKAKVIFLEQNYRSTKNILKAAQTIIEKNPAQMHKKLWTENQAGHQIISHEAAHEEDEALVIAKEIKRLLEEEGESPENCAVLYRINSQSRVLEEQFLKQGLPYRIVGGLKFYERAEIKDLIAYLKLSLNFSDQLSLARIINVPKRSIGKTTVEKLVTTLSGSGQNFVDFLGEIKKETRKSPFPKSKTKDLILFASLIEKIAKVQKQKSLKETLAFILKETGYRRHLLALGEEGKERLENVLELLSVAERYAEFKPEEASLRFLEEAALATSEENPYGEKPCVTLMTLHSAKGLEFKRVFLPGFEEGLLPHSRSLENPLEMEEERRLCYVGITRAKENLWLLYTRNRRIFGQSLTGVPSRFFRDIPLNILEKRITPPMHQDYSYPQTDSSFWEDRNIEW